MAVQLHVVRNMGCLGWVECYWCPYWVHNPLYPTIWDGIERPLCEWCFQWYCYMPNMTASLMSLVLVGELPEYCKNGWEFDILWMNEYAWRLLHF
jgi:hypothetical protein